MTASSTMKPSALVAAAHIIASDGPGEVVRKLDAAFDAAAAPATSAQVQALHRARRALHAISKTYDDSELRTRALEADEEIDRMLTAVPQAPAAPVTYSPTNPPPLRREGESVDDYRRRMGWSTPEPTDAFEQAWRSRPVHLDQPSDKDLAKHWWQAGATLAAAPKAPERHGVVTRRMLRSLAERDVIDERRRQVSDEGCSTKQDDMYQRSELALAAAWYATPPCTRFALDANDMGLWPLSWLPTSFKPGDRRRELVKSGALIIAELERLDREAALAKEGGEA